MKFEETICKFCKTNQSPIFFMPKASSKDDYWCGKCMEEKMAGE